MSEFTDKMSDWAASNPVVSNAANFLKDPIGATGKALKNTAQDLQTVFTQKDPRQASFSIVDENGDIQEYNLSSGGRVYKRPDGTYTNQRGYAYLSTGDDGKLILNVSKSVADSDWFKTKFTENSTFKKVLNMFNANPSAETTITTTDEDGNTKNVTLAEAVKQYNDALGQYASNYEGISLLRDYYNNNTGLNLTDDQIRISENSLSKDSDKQDETKVIYIPDSWQSIYDFSKLASWDPETKTVSAKDFFNVYNLDKEGGISEEQWQDLEAATEADLERAFSGIVSKNLNTEDPEAIKYAGDKLAKAIAAGKTLNNSKPDVSGLHATAIFASSAGEEFVSKLSKTYGNLTEFIIGQTEWLADSPIAPVSVGGEAIQGALFLADTPRNAMLAALGAIGDDIASGALSEGNASNYIEEVKKALGDSWDVVHGDKDFTSEYKFLPNEKALDEFTSTIDADIDYMEKISGAAAGGKFVGNILEMAVEVYITEKTGGLVGGAIESSAMSIGRGLGLVFRGSKIKDQANLLTKLFLAASKTTAWTGNMLVQGFMDTVESDTGQLATQMLMSKELTESQKQELYNAMASNTVYNVGASVVVDKMIPGFLETKPGHFVQTRAQKIAAAISLPGAKANISLAKLINGIGGGKKISQATMDALNKEFVNFGVNDINPYMVKAAEANYAATKQIASAKVGESYTDAITGRTVKAASTTEAIDIAVNNKIRLQNMLDRVTRGFKAETEEILASPDIAKTRSESYAAASKVVEAEGGVGKKAAVQEIHGTKVVSFAQEDSNYLVYRRNLDYMDRKEAYAIANGKELSAGDKEFQTALRTAVESFEASNSPKLVEALENYYQANMAFNKAMTDWEVAHGIMSKETYESLKATGFFGLEDEFYVHTIAIKPTGAKFTDDYEAAYAEYMRTYNRHVGDSYRINPTHITDQHISRKFDPEQNYLDPELANAARISSMAQAYQAKNWGKALLGVGMPLKEIDTEGKLTSSAEIKSAMKSADAASVSAVERLTKEKLQPVLDEEGIITLGTAAKEEYDLEGKLARAEAKEASKLGIANDEAVSKNVSKLSQEQVTENLESISGAPTYGKVKSYEEYQSMIDSMPTKEMRAKAEKAVKTQEGAYDKTQKQSIKEFEAQKKERLAQATALEKEASNIDKEVARIEKNNASGQAKYEKAKANAEKKIKAAEEKAKKAAASRAKYEESLAKDNEFYSGITDKRGKKMYNDLYNDLNDAAIDQFQFDVKDAQELDVEDAISAVSEARSEEVRNVFKKGTNKKEFINRRRELANLVDNGEITKIEAQKKLIDEYVDPDYLNNARAKAFGKNDTSASQSPVKALNAGGPNERLAKTVKLDYIESDIDASIADSVKELVDKKYHVEDASSGLSADYPGKEAYEVGNGYISFDAVLLAGTKADKVHEAAKKAGMMVEENVSDGGSHTLDVLQDVAKDGTLLRDIERQATKEIADKVGADISDPKNGIKNAEKLGIDYEASNKIIRDRSDATRRILREHGGLAFPDDASKQKAWDTFFEELGAKGVSPAASGVTMPEPFVPESTAEKVAEAAAKREEAARIRGEVDSLRAPRSLSDKQKTVKAWNDAVKNESTMIPGLNKMWLQDAITSKSVDIPEEVMNNIKTQIANRTLAEHTEIDLIDNLVMRSKNPIKTAESIDKWLDDLEGIRGDISRLKDLLKAQKEGVTPFAEASRSILGEIVDGTKIAFEKNPVSARVLELAKEQGVKPELVKEYMAINALLRENGNGELVLRNDIQAATKKRIEKEMLSQIRAEDKVDTGMIKHVVKRFQDVIEETAKESWASIQKQLIDAGGNGFIDVGKNFNYVKKEMEKFVGQFHAANVIPMIGADGELKYYEVSPLIADLYQSRPLANYSKLSNFFNKTSRIARISSTNLNATSVVNQCFRDPLNAYIGAGMYKGFKAYENEMAELFGPELVAHLQEEMSAAGWDIFTEGGKVAGGDLEKKAAAYIVETTGADTFAKGSTQNALFEAQRTAARGARQGALDNLEYWNKQYKKSKLSLDDIIDKGARVVGAPGYKINESRELFLRKADYASAFNTALRQGKTVLEAKNIAEFVSRQATTNFGRMFMWGNSIVNAVPFLGAAINGSASFWRLVAIDPVGVSTRFVTAGLAMMSLVAQSMTTKRDREIYKTVPEWMKQENVVFVYDGEVMKIPIPQELGAFLAPFRQAVEKSHPGVQSHEWLELLTNDLLEVSPIELDGFETLDEINIDGDPTIWDRLSREGSALVSQFAPPFVKAAYMNATGVDPYTGNPIDTSYTWIDEDGNVQIVDNNQSSFAKWFSGKLEAAGIEKSTSVCYNLLKAAFGSGLLNVADGITNLFQGNPSNGVIATQLKEGLQAVRAEPYQLSDPYLREFKATIKELEEEKNAMLSADGDLAKLSQQLSMLKETDSGYDTKRKNLIREYNQKTEDYRQRVLNTVQNYNNHYGSTYTSQQFAAVVNLLTFDKSTLMPTNAYQSEQLSQLYYSAREQAYQTMIDMGFDSTTDNSIFGIARRNKYTGEVEIKYTSPTVILNMDNVAMGSGRVYAAELEQALKSAGLTKSARIQGYNDAKAKGSKALKQFKKEWNAEVAQAISETMNKYGSGNVINSGDAVQLLNEYFYISNTSYKVKDYLKDVFGEEE